MSGHEDQCQLVAVWEHRTIPAAAFAQVAAHDALDERLRAANAAAAYTVPERTERVSTASVDAFDVGVAHGLDFVLRPEGVTITDPLPLLLGHHERIVDDLDAITRVGSRFEVASWIPAEAGKRLRREGLWHVSPGIRVDECRVVDAGFGLRYVDVERWTLYELSATSSPLLSRTMLMCGDPGVQWLASDDPGILQASERFDVGPLRFAPAGLVP